MEIDISWSFVVYLKCFGFEELNFKYPRVTQSSINVICKTLSEFFGSFVISSGAENHLRQIVRSSIEKNWKKIIENSPRKPSNLRPWLYSWPRPEKHEIHTQRYLTQLKTNSNTFYLHFSSFFASAYRNVMAQRFKVCCFSKHVKWNRDSCERVRAIS